MSGAANCSLCYERDTIYNPTYSIHADTSDCSCRMHRKCFEIWSQTTAHDWCFECTMSINPGRIGNMPSLNPIPVRPVLNPREEMPRFRFPPHLFQYFPARNQAQLPPQHSAPRHLD